MPTPYTEGNGCAYCQISNVISRNIGSPSSIKSRENLLCLCQGPEIVPCTCYSLVDAMKCEHFKPESWDVEKFCTQLANDMQSIPKVPLGNVEMVEETDNGVKVTAKLTKEGKRIMGEEETDFAKKFNEKVSKLCGCDDVVNHPSHYTAGGIECIDAIKAALECHEDPVGAWLTGQCIKYLWRWPLKNGLEDLKKCRFYLDRLIDSFEEED